MKCVCVALIGIELQFTIEPPLHDEIIHPDVFILCWQKIKTSRREFAYLITHMEANTARGQLLQLLRSVLSSLAAMGTQSGLPQNEEEKSGSDDEDEEEAGPSR